MMFISRNLYFGNTLIQSNIKVNNTTLLALQNVNFILYTWVRDEKKVN